MSHRHDLNSCFSAKISTNYKSHHESRWLSEIIPVCLLGPYLAAQSTWVKPVVRHPLGLWHLTKIVLLCLVVMFHMHHKSFHHIKRSSLKIKTKRSNYPIFRQQSPACSRSLLQPAPIKPITTLQVYLVSLWSLANTGLNYPKTFETWTADFEPEVIIYQALAEFSSGYKKENKTGCVVCRTLLFILHFDTGPDVSSPAWTSSNRRGNE